LGLGVAPTKNICLNDLPKTSLHKKQTSGGGGWGVAPIKNKFKFKIIGGLKHIAALPIRLLIGLKPLQPSRIYGHGCN
jgi:hypothetical protein